MPGPERLTAEEKKHHVLSTHSPAMAAFVLVLGSDRDILGSIPILRAVAFPSNTSCVKATPSSP